LYTLSIQDSTW